MYQFYHQFYDRTLTVLSPTKHDVAPRWMIAAAFGQQAANV